MGSITPEWFPQVLKEADFVSLRIYWKYLTLFNNCGMKLLCSKVENSILNISPFWLKCLHYASALWMDEMCVRYSAVFKCVGSQGAEDQQNVEFICVCVRARVRARVFISQFSIPALRGECFLWVPLLFWTYTSPSALVPIIEMIVNEFETANFSNCFWKNMTSEILYYKWFSFYFCTYVLCTAVNCPEMIIKDVL